LTTFAAELVATRPEEVALDDGRSQLRWGDVEDRLNRVANALLALGSDRLGADRRVAVFAENAAETALAHIGGLLAGASSPVQLPPGGAGAPLHPR
jgi:long-chain acyl-CoA synthetase